jgi:DNA polymerase III delta subunit
MSGAPLPPLHLVLGDSHHLIEAEVQAVIRAALAAGASSFNQSSWSAEDGAEGLVSEARTQPMMSKLRLVVLRGIEKAPAALMDALSTYAESPSPTTVLVLSGEKLPVGAGMQERGRRLQRAVEAAGVVKRSATKDQDPVAFAQAQARELGAELSRDAARLLVELCGRELGRLALEVEKAVAWAGGAGPVDVEAVEAVATLIPESASWDLTDALIARDPDRALAAVQRLSSLGGSEQSPHRLLASVTWQLRSLLELQSALRAGAPPPEAWRRVPARKLAQAERRVRSGAIDPAALLETLVQANQRMNRAKAGDQRVLEELVLGLTAG